MKTRGLTFLFLLTLAQFSEASPSIYVEVIQIDDLGFSKMSCIPRGRGDKSIKDININVSPSYLEAYLRALSEDSKNFESAKKFVTERNESTGKTKMKLLESEYFYCEDLNEKQVLAYVEENPDCVEHSAGIKGISFLNKSLTNEVSNFTGNEDRNYLSRADKSKYNALGTIRASNSKGNGVFIGSAEIVEIEGMPTNKTLVITSAHVINAIEYKGNKQFCIGDDTTNPSKSNCYRIIDSLKGYDTPEGEDSKDWAVLVLEKKVDSVIVNGKYEKTKPFLIKKDSNDYTSLVSDKIMTNVAYSEDIERRRIKAKKQTKSWPTVTQCTFREKSQHAQVKTTDSMEIHDCHTESGASGSAFVVQSDNKNYIYALHHGSRGKKLHYTKSFHNQNHYNKAVKVQGKFYRAIEKLSQNYTD